MSNTELIREAPFSFVKTANEQTYPVVPVEPVLNLDNIQGNIIGFNKDFQTFIFLKISDFQAFRYWLGQFVPFVATAREVLSFNNLFKEIRNRRRADTPAVQSTWINIAFSFNCLAELTANGDKLSKHAQNFPAYKDKLENVADLAAAQFVDKAFKDGLAARAVSELSDPQTEQSEGNPKNWIFGGTGNEADAVIIVASDSLDELNREVSRIENSIYEAQANVDELDKGSGMAVMFKQNGAALAQPLKAREHFGFVDNISQPGIRGRISEMENDVLTLRQDPDEKNNGKPGQELIWTGEFVFGYESQSEFPDPKEPGELNRNPGPVAEAGPIWGSDGSFLVIRRLRQDVKTFHNFLEYKSKELGISGDLLGAKLVGRWTSGAPIIRTPYTDDPALGADDCANNNFEFLVDGAATANPPAVNQCSDQHPNTAVADHQGIRCPFAAHIRKIYPRDDTSTLLGDDLTESFVQNRRILRRGIPYGEPYHHELDTEQNPDSGDRGLMFLAYQTSIVNQFEYIQKKFANDPEFINASKDGVLQSGHDFIIGQNNDPSGTRKRTFVLPLEKDGKTELINIETESDWVIPTGDGYFFQPSIDALCLFAGISR